MDKKTETEFRRIASLLQAGKLGLAQQGAKAAVAQHPRAFFPHNMLGVVQSSVGQWKAAKKHFAKALKFDPDNRDGLRNLGTADLQLGELQAAQKTLTKLVRLYPNHAEGWFTLGNLHLARQARARAQECFQKAFELKPDYEMAANNLMWLQEISNQMDALEQTVSALEQALPKSAVGGLYRGILQIRQGDFAAAKATLEPFAFNPAASRDMARLEGRRLDQLARAEDALGHQAAAFELFTKSNALNQSRLAHPSVSAARHMAGLEAAHRYFIPGFSKGWEPAARSEAEPVFMIGFPRSGATLLAGFLQGHTGVEIINEQPLVQKLRQDIGSFNTENFDKLDSLTLGAMEIAAKTYLRAAKSDKVAVDVLPLNLAYTGEILRVFPKAKFILVQRDPADCVVSAFKQPFSLNDATATMDSLENAAKTFDAEYSLWTQVQAELSPSTITLRYEALVENPEKALRPVLAFLGLEWEPELIEKREAPQQEADFMAGPAALPLYRDAIGHWQRYESHMGEALTILAPWRRAQGYGDKSAADG